MWKAKNSKAHVFPRKQVGNKIDRCRGLNISRGFHGIGSGVGLLLLVYFTFRRHSFVRRLDRPSRTSDRLDPRGRCIGPLRFKHMCQHSCSDGTLRASAVPARPLHLHLVRQISRFSHCEIESENTAATYSILDSLPETHNWPM